MPKVEVYKDSFARMEARTGKPYDAMIDLDITSPCALSRTLRTPLPKRRSARICRSSSAVCEARRNPWFNMFKIVGDHAEMVIEPVHRPPAGP